MNQFNRNASGIVLALTLATVTGCAATPATESTGEYIDSTAITAKVKAGILEQPKLRLFDIHVETSKGVVRLGGYAASQSSIDKAVEIARRVDGVKSVNNEMRIVQQAKGRPES
jgi:hyperosmotically inducible protein